MRGPNDAVEGQERQVEKRVKVLAIQIFRRRVLHSHVTALVESLGKSLLKCLMNNKKTNMAGKIQAKERVVRDQIMQGLEGHYKDLGFAEQTNKFKCTLCSGQKPRAGHYR